MRSLLILPGNSLKNKAWGEAVAAHYGPRFERVVAHEYEHWETGAATIDFNKEVERVKEAMVQVPEGNEVTVFAKSAGSLLTFIAVKAGAVVPARCVFFGIPFDLAATGLFEHDWSPVESFSVPAIAFHNEGDPTAAYQPTVDMLAAYAPHITLVTTYESDHWYGDFATYNEPLKSFLPV
jgi:hypothetical protein